MKKLKCLNVEVDLEIRLAVLNSFTFDVTCSENFCHLLFLRFCSFIYSFNRCLILPNRDLLDGECVSVCVLIK